MVNIPSLSHYYWLISHNYWLPSGKRLHSYGKSPALIGKSANEMAISCNFRYVKWPEWDITAISTDIPGVYGIYGMYGILLDYSHPYVIYVDMCGIQYRSEYIYIYLSLSLSLFNLDMNGRLLGYSLTINGILASGYYWNNITYNTIRDIWIHTHIYIYIWINRNGIQWDKQLGIFHGTKKCGTAKLGTKSQLMSIIIQQTQQNESLRVYLKNNP